MAACAPRVNPKPQTDYNSAPALPSHTQKDLPICASTQTPGGVMAIFASRGRSVDAGLGCGISSSHGAWFQPLTHGLVPVLPSLGTTQ